MEEVESGEAPAGAMAEVAASHFPIAFQAFLHRGHIRRDQGGRTYCQNRRSRGTVMRHGSSPAGAVALLSEGMAAGSLGRRLVAAAGRPDGLSPAEVSAGSGAITLAPVTSGADPDLLAALPALEDPVTLLDCRSGRGP